MLCYRILMLGRIIPQIIDDDQGAYGINHDFSPGRVVVEHFLLPALHRGDQSLDDETHQRGLADPPQAGELRQKNHIASCLI